MWLSWFLPVCGSAFFAVSMVAGARVAQVVFQRREKSFLVAAAPMMAAAALSLWMNAAGTWVGWKPAAVGWFVLASWLAWRAVRAWPQAEDDSLWSELKRVMRVAVPVLLVLSFVGGVFDEGWHFPLAALMANGNWPTRFPFNPEVSLTYHFGFELLSGATATFGLWVPVASDLWQVALMTSLVCLAYRWVARSIEGVVGRRVATLLWYGAGSLGWVLRPLRAWAPLVLRDVPPFTSVVGNAVGLIFFTKSQLMAFGVLFLLLEPRTWMQGWRRWVVFPLLLAAAALSSETFTITILAGLCLGLLLEARSWRERLALLGSGLVGVALMAMQGGLLTDLARHAVGLATEAQVGVTSFVWRSSPLMRAFNGVTLDLRSVWTWIRLGVEWGGMGILALAAFATWMRRPWSERGMLLAAIGCLLLPFVLMFPIGEHDTLRFWGNAFVATGFMGAPVVWGWMRARRAWQLAACVALMVLGGVGSIIGSNIPVIRWMGRVEPQVISSVLVPPFLAQQTLPPGSVVWVSATRVPGEIPDVVREVPLVTGAYVQGCYDFYNRDTRNDCETFLQAPSVAGLEALRVTHVLVSDAWAADHLAAIAAHVRLQARFEKKVAWWDRAWCRIAACDDSLYTLYVVH